MTTKKDIVILGAGQAAAYAAKEIRSIDSKTNITIIGEEKNFPYERPPLSKDCLLDKINYDKCLFFPPSFYEENNINFLNNQKITYVDFKKKTLRSSKDVIFSYDKLLITTGSINRQYNFDGLSEKISANMIYLRNIEDSQKIKEKLLSSNKILIIGGGFIGLEIASAASQLGKKVTIVEMAKHLMGRIVPNQISKIFQKTHEDNGCEFYLDDIIEKITKKDQQFEVKLRSGAIINNDLIIVGIGSIPNTKIFEQSELELDNGIVTDEFSQTSIEDVYAAGDVTNFYHPFYKKNIRLESYRHAQNHGISAGKNIVGERVPYAEIPWMWSDQYNLNLQLTGICNDYDTCIKRGDNINEGIIYFFLKNMHIIGACGVGISGKIGRDIRLAGILSKRRIKVKKEILEDKNQKLNKILT